MKTDALIEALARDLHPVRPRPVWPRLAAAGTAGVALAGAVVIFIYGVRPDLRDAIGAVLAKLGFCLAAVAAAAPLALNLAQPSIRARAWLWPAALLIAASLAAASIALAVTAPDARFEAWTAGGLPECLRRIPILAIPVAAALASVARGLTPTRLTLAGAALGGLAGALAAAAYSWFCPIDSVAYVATWYLAAILICAGLGAVLGRWLLRW